MSFCRPPKPAFLLECSSGDTPGRLSVITEDAMKMLRAGIVFSSILVSAVGLMNVGTAVNAQSGTVTSTEAPAGFDNLSNGNVSQDEFDVLLRRFAEKKTIADGIGPVYNAVSCADCHENPVVGGNSQV